MKVLLENISGQAILLEKGVNGNADVILKGHEKKRVEKEIAEVCLKLPNIRLVNDAKKV